MQTSAEIQVNAIFLCKINIQNFTTSISICMETPCWPEANKNMSLSLPYKRGKFNKNYNSTFSNFVQMAKFHEIQHVLANITALSAAV